jgi:hypothetical protein
MSSLTDPSLHQKTIDRIVSYFHKVDRPVLVGTISLEYKFNLSQTKIFFDYLEDKGIIRQMTDDEKKEKHLDKRCDAYMLTSKADISKVMG